MSFDLFSLSATTEPQKLKYSSEFMHASIMGLQAEAEVAGLGAEVKAVLKTAPTSRIYFLDNLKVLLAILVVLHHSAQPYGPGGGWWIASDPNQTIIDFIVLGLLMALNMSFFMGLFFMISAYFLPASLDRKGPAKFMKDRLIKLGAPILVFMLGVFPVIGYWLFHYCQPFINFYLSYINIFNPQSQLSVGHLWFLAMLLIFSAVYVAHRLVKKPSSNKAGLPRKYGYPGLRHGPGAHLFRCEDLGAD